MMTDIFSNFAADIIVTNKTEKNKDMRNIPVITKNLLIINLIVFLAGLVITLPGGSLNDVCGLHFFLASDFHLYQLLSYMFLHASFTHIFFNMFALWMFGCVIERVWGPKKFLFYYISCGVGAGLMQEIAQLVQFYVMANDQIPDFSASELLLVARNSQAVLNQWTTVGASGAIYAILLAFGMTFPNERIFIFPLPIPIKAKWFVMFYAVVELALALSASGDGVAHTAHLGGMLFGFFMIRYWNRHSGIGYNRRNGMQFFDNLRQNFERHRHNAAGGRMKDDASRFDNTSRMDDWEYNARKKARQEEVDRILDKIRKSGYDSLTKEEKQKLFDSSND